MAQAEYAYDDWDDSAVVERMALSVSIFADRPHIRAEVHEDVIGAGFRAGHCDALAVLFGSDPIALGEAVLLDCPHADAATLAALARLDMRIARAGARLIVSTTMDALDGVFACLDQTAPQILVAPTRAERIIALGRLLGGAAGTRLRDMSEEDRLQILRLTEQVERLARHFDSAAGLPFDAAAHSGNVPTEMAKGGRPPLPDPRLVRKIVRHRQLRARYFDGSLFADPAWDILLDLTAARAEHARVSVSSLCIASGVPATTALRWITQMVEAGLLERQEDVTDRRRAFIALSDMAADAMARYFAELGRDAVQLV